MQIADPDGNLLRLGSESLLNALAYGFWLRGVQ